MVKPEDFKLDVAMTTLNVSIISLFGMASFVAKATQIVVVRKSRVRRIPSICFLSLGCFMLSLEASRLPATSGIQGVLLTED